VAEKDPEFGKDAQWALYYQGGQGLYFKGVEFPKECYLPVLITWPFNEGRENNGGRVLDFSNPLTVKTERERVFKTFESMPGRVHCGSFDYADMWDKWPGQFDPSMSAAETWRAGAAPWREIHKVAPRLRNLSYMSKVDFSYGFVDIARISDDADYSFPAFLTSACIGTAMRFFYNGRVYWNNADNFHVYRYKNGEFGYNQGKVSANFHAIAANTSMPSERFDRDYPEDRLELLKRVSPPTEDVSYPVDLFERIPAAVWNMPIERPFGRWNVLAVFNYGPVEPENSTGTQADPFTVKLDAAKDLRLDPNKEYVVYEFWSRKLLGTFKGKFTSRPIKSVDCDIYSIVERQAHPMLISTSRHVRQMAMDVKNVTWNAERKELRGTSRAVSGDPYQLRIYVPSRYRLDHVDVPTGLTAKHSINGYLLTVDYTTSASDDVTWSVFFNK